MTTPCAQQPDLWFSEDRHNIKRAKDICGGCPVRLECLKVALDGNEAFGIFGGLTPDERAGITTTTPKVCLLPECGKALTGTQRRYCSHLHSNRASSRKRYVRRVAS